MPDEGAGVGSLEDEDDTWLAWAWEYHRGRTVPTIAGLSLNGHTMGPCNLIQIRIWAPLCFVNFPAHNELEHGPLIDYCPRLPFPRL